MKRVVALLSLVMAVALLCGCAFLPDKPVALSDYLAKTQFDALNEAVEGGTDLPTQMFFYQVNGANDTITDQEFIVQTWKQLRDLQISPKTEMGLAISDGDMGFSFRWDDGSTYIFSFETSEYYEDAKGGLHQIQDTEQMRTLLKSLINYLDEQAAQAEAATANGTPVTLVDGSIFSWDADGDGTDETFSVTYYDNGDEAPNNIEIQGVSAWYDSAWIDAAYSITQMYARSDDWGPYLYVEYTWGDYWYHDNFGFCEIRLQDGVLTTIY